MTWHLSVCPSVFLSVAVHIGSIDKQVSAPWKAGKLLPGRTQRPSRDYSRPRMERLIKGALF